jgi:predicted RNase H-like HicB family nuclease
MREYRFTVFFEPLEEGGYNVIVPAIPEICTSGETLDEARDMARDAIRCFIERTHQGTDCGEFLIDVSPSPYSQTKTGLAST